MGQSRMKIALITDAWRPQINGVVTTLVELVDQLNAKGHVVEVIHPDLFQTRPCPGYAGIDLAVRPYSQLAKQLDAFQPDVIHVATEGPLGWAARKYCVKHGFPFTTAFHTRFPEVLKAALRIPLWMGYALFRHFHKASAGVLVPTQGVMRLLDGWGFKNLRSWTHGVDMRLFEYAEVVANHPDLMDLPRPIALYVGRVSYEKNIESFLAMPWHGSKVVCGVGPLERELKEKFHHIRWLGVLPREELARVYASADVFTFPSRNETFGLVMLEAMACGTPVAAYPVDGPLEVLRSQADFAHAYQGGLLHEDLAYASLEALKIPRAQARAQALSFSWDASTRLFEQHVVRIERAEAKSQEVYP
jgi:glycosyltransferase involved in cell wall biosynthesis